MRDRAEERIESASQVAISGRPADIIERDLALGKPLHGWSEFSPTVYELAVSLSSTDSGEPFSDETRADFGMREISAAGRQIKLNGRAIGVRGTVDNGSFPRKGYPPTDVATYRGRFQTYKDYGFNHVRFHSWCPPDAAFAAADELGMLLQVENPLWIGDGRVSADALRAAFIRQEAESIVDGYGNHPSFALMTMGNELGSGLDVFLGDLIRSLESRDGRHLYASTSHPDDPRRPDNYFVSAGPRWQLLRDDPRLEKSPPNTDFDYREYVAKLDRPVIAHELGQWTVFPNLDEARKYDGPLQPRYLEIYREALERHSLLGQAEDYRKASGALMVALYKEEIESILRTPDLAGFQLLGLSDWPGFGPAFVGVLDTVVESKGLIEPQAFRRFCGPTVLLLRMRKRSWTSAETFIAPVEIAHYGPSGLDDLSAAWKLRDAAGREVASGRLPPAKVPAGGLTPLGSLHLPLKACPAPARYSVEVSAGGFANDWDLWVYPDKLPPAPRGIVVSDRWDESTRQAVSSGRTVVLLASGKRAGTTPTSFTSAFGRLPGFPNVTRPWAFFAIRLIPPWRPSQPMRTPTGNGGTS